MSIIHIKLKGFCWEENFALDKRKDNVEIAAQIYWKLKLVRLCIKNNVMIMFM